MRDLQGDLPCIVRTIANNYTKQQPGESVPTWMRRAGEVIAAKHSKDPVVMLNWETEHTLVTSMSIVKSTLDKYHKECKGVTVPMHPIRVPLGFGTPVDFPYDALTKILLDSNRIVEDTHKEGHVPLRVLTVCADKKSYTARVAWL